MTILLVDGSTRTVNTLAGHKHLGRLITPIGHHSLKNVIDSGMIGGADNGCFTGFNKSAYTKMVDRISILSDKSNLVFVTVPDIVADGKTTLMLFNEWGERVRGLGVPVALVAQDNMMECDIPWGDLDAIFIGGSTKWKLGDSAVRIIIRGKSLGKWIHVGRVNTRSRIKMCMALGVDSIDGSQFSRWGDTHIPWALQLLESRQMAMEDIIT